MSAQGIFVVVADVDRVEGEAAVNELNKSRRSANYFEVDVSQERAVESLVEDVYREFGRLDYIFNNAGISMYGELYDMTLDHWRRLMDINLWGVIYGTQTAYRIMKQQGFGHIVNTASATGLGPSPTAAAYAATKHAIVGLTTSLHYEAEAFGVKVSALCPAFVDTPIFAKSVAINMDRDKINEQVKKQVMSPDKFVAIAMKGIKRNEPVICPMPLRKTTNILFTLFPFLHRKLMRLVCKFARQARTN